MNKFNEHKLTFLEWLKLYEFTSAEDFNKLPNYKKENYRVEYDMWLKGVSQYNK